MKDGTVLLNLIWPAIYVYEELSRFWYLVFATIFLEVFTIRFIRSYSWWHSILASVAGNIVSSFLGSIVMMWAMLFWHMLVDYFLSGTFNPVNQVATYLLMCAGSVYIETLVVSLLFKDSPKRLFLPVLVGNLLTYSFIGFNLELNNRDNGKDDRVFVAKYTPVKKRYLLLDSSQVFIHRAIAKRLLSIDSNAPGSNYFFDIRFTKSDSLTFQFDFESLDQANTNGIDEHRKELILEDIQDTVEILLIQKHPHPDTGWTKPLCTDTVLFIKQN